jgi:ubiquitin C-terminal hydrolase
MSEITEKSQQSEKSINTKMRGVVGLANIGNTCYMNSVLQALRHCPEWTLFCTKGTVDEHIQTKDSPSSKILYAYKDILKSLWAGTGPAYVIPRGFFDQLKLVVKGTIYDDFIQRTPQDAHEFLVWLLDQMYMATQKKITIVIRESQQSQQSQETQQTQETQKTQQTKQDSMKLLALKGWKAAFEHQYSPLTDLIFGMHRIQYSCSNCHAVHTSWETFNILKITPQKNTDWMTCIQDEFKSEEIEGYHCDACHGKHTTTKQIHIWRLPKVMMITVRRFTPMGTKDSTPIQYDGTSLNLSSLFAPESQESSRKHNYHVFGTVDHHGSIGGGHYISQTLNPVWNTWHLYDDQAAHPIEKPSFGSNTYIMFFRPVVKNLNKDTDS